MAFGAQDITIGTVTFVAENISYEDPSNWTVTKDSVGVPNKQHGVDDVPTGSATLQLPDTTTAPPAKYATFSLTPIGGGTAITVIISKVGQAFQQDGERKVNIDFRKKLN
jgi:hypothetical protein